MQTNTVTLRDTYPLTYAQLSSLSRTVVGLLLHAPHVGISLQNSVLLHDLCRGARAPCIG